MSEQKPLFATTRTMRRPQEANAFNYVKLLVVRDGSAILSGAFGQQPLNVGEVALLGAEVSCGAEPEGRVTVTTVYLDPGYTIDLFYWQYTGLLLDRLEAADIAAIAFAEPLQVIRFGEQQHRELGPWLDDLVELSEAGKPWESFARMQALWFLIADAIRPFLKTVPVPQVLAQSAKARPQSLRNRRLTAAVRIEALSVRDALRDDIGRRWLLRELAEIVHLSPKQLTRVFTAAYGKTPSAYLRMLRVEEMARLFRETDTTVDAAARRVGWSRNQASEMFTRHIGTSPGRYRLYGPSQPPGRGVGSAAHLSGDDPRFSGS